MYCNILHKSWRTKKKKKKKHYSKKGDASNASHTRYDWLSIKWGLRLSGAIPQIADLVSPGFWGGFFGFFAFSFGTIWLLSMVHGKILSRTCDKIC
jgi:hypothetical protein